MNAVKVAKSLGLSVAEVDVERGTWTFEHALLEPSREYPSQQIAAEEGIEAMRRRLNEQAAVMS